MQTLIVYCAILFSVLNRIACSKNTRLADCDVFLLSMYSCDADGYAEFDMKLRNIDDNGGKAVDMSIYLEELLDESYNISVEIDRAGNGDWENIYRAEQPLFTTINQFGSVIWESMRQQSEPPIESDSEIEPPLRPEDNDILASGFYCHCYLYKFIMEHPAQEKHREYIKIGYYVVNKFQCDASDLNVPTAMLGRFRVKNIVKDPDGEMFACKMCEFEVDEK